MNKLLLVFLAIAMCVSMCACGGNQESDVSDISEQSAPIETVDVDILLGALDNQAKAEMYVGKGTEMYVTINTIYSDYCEVVHILKNKISKLYMPKEELAKLERGEYMTFFAVVDTVENSGSSFTYTFRDAETRDMDAFDKYYEDAMARIISGLNRYYFLDNYENNCKKIVAHVEKRGRALRVSEAEITSYLEGTWERQVNQAFHEGYLGSEVSFYGEHTPEITFFENGTTLREELDSYWMKPSDLYPCDYELVEGKWNIIDGSYVYISGFCFSEEYGSPIYRVTDDMFVYNNIVFLRVEE